MEEGEESGSRTVERLPLSSLRVGPFLSGTTFQVYQLGQRIGAGGEDPMDLQEGAPEPVKGRATPSVGRGGKAGKATGKRGGAVNLATLVAAGLLHPGRNRISVVYKGVTYLASLNKEGQILYQGKRFQSATAFSIHCKRQQTPGKQGDDGWKSTLYEGTPLEVFRRRYGAVPGAPPVPAPRGRGGGRQKAQSFVQPDDEAIEEFPEGPSPGEPAPRARGRPGSGAGAASAARAGAGAASAARAGAGAGAAAGASTDQWVQCDRCRTWRIVPDSDWAAVEADERDVWYCEDATWDVATQVPHTPACK